MQTDFNMYLKPFVIGQIADTSPRTIDSHAAEVEIKFGTALKRGTDKRGQCLPFDGVDTFLGIAVRDDLCTEGHYQVGDVVQVMRMGRVVIVTTKDVVAGDIAYVHPDGTFNNIDKDGIEIGIFFTEARENSLAVLEVQGPVRGIGTEAKEENKPTNKNKSNLIDIGA